MNINLIELSRKKQEFHLKNWTNLNKLKNTKNPICLIVHKVKVKAILQKVVTKQKNKMKMITVLQISSINANIVEMYMRVDKQ